MSAAIEVSQRDSAAAAPLAPATKTARHACIVQILSRERIRSQAQLRRALALRGISTTQATLSRDLVELRATKIRAPGGELIYSMPEAGAPGQVHAGGFAGGEETDDSLPAHTTPRLARWCAELLVTAEWAGSQLVLRTPAGAAQLLAGAVDDAMMPGVLGCIAGDDTVLVITRSPQVAAEVAGHLLALADPSTRT